MSITSEILLAFCMFLGAVLYSSVGHAGASAYIAAMALFGVDTATMRPTALVLNIIVASFATWQYVRAGFFNWRTLWPVLIGAIPMAFIGGAIQLPGQYYRPLVGVVLLLSAVRLLLPKVFPAKDVVTPMQPLAGIASGLLIGLLAGLTGTGGGIFLSPLLIITGWASPKNTSGISAAFILCNSIAGLAGNLASVRYLPPDLPLLAGAVLIGAFIGTKLGISRFASRTIIQALALVLVIAGLKMLGIA